MNEIQQKHRKRLCGTVIPVGALRGKGSMGVGEFPDLADFALLCKKMGLGLIQILPVNDSGYESSPYSSLSAFALHPLYLRIEDLDEYGASPAEIKEKLKAAGSEFENDARYSHYRILRAKMEILRDIFAANRETIAKKAASDGVLAKWIEENPWVKEFAAYRRLKEKNEDKSWKEWAEYRDVTATDIEVLWNDEKLREEHLFWVWLQEALDSQFRKASQAIAEAGIMLEGDLPILMNEDSCDVWAHPEIFIQGLSAGAPPDMYCPEGQNWGFPIYNWEAQEKDDFAWWKRRLAVAERYYQAYRIDHVLGFFRIWASPRSDYSAALGRYIPYIPIKTRDLAALGFDKGRIRWLSLPHIPTDELLNALRENWGGPFSEEDIAAAANKIFSKCLTQVRSEELWLFKKRIQGEKDIDALKLHPGSRAYLFKAWQNRTFLEHERGRFFPVCHYWESRAYKSLSEEEKQNMEALIEKHKTKSEKLWAVQGKKFLNVLRESSSMLPCAEDLGAVPNCVPAVLAKLKILGLRVVRWFREWGKEGEPYIPFGQYPEMSVCTTAVHDSSTLRQWWEGETDQYQFSGFIGYPSLPKVYNPGTAKAILYKTATAKSRFRVFQIQDLLHLSPKWYAEDPASERINVPGTCNDFNWTYRLPASIEEIGKDKDLIKVVAGMVRAKPETASPLREMA
ncbi:MAG: 4-alpha-glucanotransferase [Treponema sp.]|jgi:4-alpha-glucanotransferase|nr:4-alpha-glucanotransferase [Treponema sp.]